MSVVPVGDFQMFLRTAFAWRPNPRQKGDWQSAMYRSAFVPKWRIPFKPVLVLGLVCLGFCTPATDLETIMRGQWPRGPLGRAEDVAMLNGYAVVACGDAGVAVIDVSNPANPQLAGGYDTSGFRPRRGGVGQPRLSGGRLCWVAGDRRERPGQSPADGRLRHHGSACGVAVSGDRAYVVT